MTREELNSMTMYTFMHKIADDLNLRSEIVKNMKQHGGSFVQCLGELLAHADRQNSFKIAEAFTNYCGKYATWEEKYMNKERVSASTKNYPDNAKGILTPEYASYIEKVQRGKIKRERPTFNPKQK